MAFQLPSEKNLYHTQRWALAVGVNYYQDNQIQDLRYCAADAAALIDLFLSQNAYGFVKERTQVLTSTSQDKDRATRLDIMQNLIELAQSTEENDLFLFHFSGYGTVFEGRPYLIPSDTKTGSLLPDTAIPLQRIMDVMQNNASARSQVIILDACYLGAELRIKSSDEAQKIFMGSVKDVFEGAEGIAILASSSHDEPSLEDASKQHGAFTYYLLDALRKPLTNENHDAHITLTEIFHYVTEKVRQYYPQRPTLEFQGIGEIVLLPALSEISKATPTENPIRRTFPVPVRATRDFYDRQIELEQVKNVLSSTTDIVITIQGERSTGKTSLLNRIRNLLTDEDWKDRQFAHLALEPRSIRTVEDLARELWDGLRKALQDAALNPPAEMDNTLSFGTYAEFAQRLESLNDRYPAVTFVAFVDEFDKISPDIGEMEYKQIIGLIHYIVEETRFPLLFIVCIRQDLPETYGSPVPSRKIYLRPFSHDNIGEMARSILGTYPHPNDELLDELYKYSGGNPYLAKLLLNKLFEQQGNDIVKWKLGETVQSAAESPEARHVFSSIYKYLNDNERYVLVWAASKEDYLLNVQEISEKTAEVRTALKDLCGRSYLVQHSDGSYRLQIALMGEWFKRWSKFELELERLRVIPSSKTDPADLPSEITSHGICIDESTQQIYVEGKRMAVDPTDLQYRALIYFVQHVGRVVSRDELVNHLHPDEAYLKSDQSLDTLIHRLRDLLGDRQKPYRYLETVHRRGFRMKNASLVRTIRTK